MSHLPFLTALVVLVFKLMDQSMNRVNLERLTLKRAERLKPKYSLTLLQLFHLQSVFQGK